MPAILGEEEVSRWCLDLDSVCALEDSEEKLIEDEEAARTRRAISDSREDFEVPKRRDSEGRERSSRPDTPRGSGSFSRDDKKNQRRRSSTKGSKKETTSPKASSPFSIPFNLSPKFDQKSTTVITTEETQEKKDVGNQSDTDDTMTEVATTTRDIKADVFMISGCDDKQTSADVSDVASFSLPNPNGRAGGACTAALLKVLYSSKQKGSELSFVQVLTNMRKILSTGRYTQTPQLTSSKKMDVSQKFFIVPPDCEGTRRALLIGINYVGQNGQLSGCHNDVNNMKDYIMNFWGFQEQNITVLMDDGYHERPTRSNILNAFKNIAYDSQSGDSIFCHYSGHGGRVRDDDWREEDDGYDETLVPVDFQVAGQIRDDDLYTSLVCALASGVTLVSLMDCCHSATVLDLPFKYRATNSGEFHMNPLSFDGGNVYITAFIMALVIVIAVLSIFLYL